MSKLANIKTNAISKLGRTGLHLKKHLPNIMTWGGVIGTGVGIFLACKATLQVEDILDDTKMQIDELGYKKTDGDISEEEHKKGLTKVYTGSVLKFGKLYAPAALVTITSMGLMLGSNSIHKSRNTALVAAYTAIEKSYNSYRNRVVDLYGEETDKNLKYGYSTENIDVEYEDEKGKTKTKKEEITVLDEDNFKEHSQYARIFDESNPNWEKNPNYNLLFLQQAQRYANDLLISRGHIFLNEVYDALGFDRTPEGSIVGWVYDPFHGDGDNYIDFGIDYVNESYIYSQGSGKRVRTESFVVEFNVDGIVFDKI